MSAGIYARMALSKHFCLSEFIDSHTAKKRALKNMPREACELANLKALCENLLEPIHRLFDKPVVIVSGFRTPTLNRLLGAKRSSQHVLGEAADFVVKGVASYDAAYTLASVDDLNFDRMQLVYRLTNGGSIQSWIHASHRRVGKNRGEIRTLTIDGDTRNITSGVHKPKDLDVSKAA